MIFRSKSKKSSSDEKVAAEPPPPEQSTPSVQPPEAAPEAAPSEPLEPLSSVPERTALEPLESLDTDGADLQNAPSNKELFTGEPEELDREAIEIPPIEAEANDLPPTHQDHVASEPVESRPSDQSPPHAGVPPSETPPPSSGALNATPEGSGHLNDGPTHEGPLNRGPLNGGSADEPSTGFTMRSPYESTSVAEVSADAADQHSSEQTDRGDPSSGEESSSGSLPARVQDPNLHIASMSGRQVAALRRRDAKDVSFVDCLVLPVEALQATPNSVGPYTFPSSEAAQAFIDETLNCLQVLGCAIQRTKEHVR